MHTQHLRNTHDTSGLVWAILQCGGSSIAVETAHGNTEERPDGQKGAVGGGETGTKFEDNEEQVVDDKGPSPG